MSKVKNRAWGTAQIAASAYLQVPCGACQSGFSLQLQLSQISTFWVCFPYTQTSGEAHRDWRRTCIWPHVKLIHARRLHPSSLTTMETVTELQERYLPKPYHKCSSAFKELGRNILPAPDQAKHLQLVEFIGILGFIFSFFLRLQVSWNKTRQCTETQGRVCSTHKQQ